MEWTENLATGIRLIDEDHKEIIRRMDDCVEASKTGDSEISVRALKMLADFCATHFSNEENLQLRGRCPNYKNHHVFHRLFLKEVAGFIEEAGKNGVSEKLANRIHDLVEDWLVAHIKAVDKKTAEHLFRVGVVE